MAVRRLDERDLPLALELAVDADRGHPSGWILEPAPQEDVRRRYYQAGLELTLAVGQLWAVDDAAMVGITWRPPPRDLLRAGQRRGDTGDAPVRVVGGIAYPDVPAEVLARLHWTWSATEVLYPPRPCAAVTFLTPGAGAAWERLSEEVLRAGRFAVLVTADRERDTAAREAEAWGFRRGLTTRPARGRPQYTSWVFGDAPSPA